MRRVLTFAPPFEDGLQAPRQQRLDRLLCMYGHNLGLAATAHLRNGRRQTRAGPALRRRSGQYPPGEQREVAVNRLLRMVAYTRCPDWQPCRRKPPRLTLVKSG